MNVINTRQNNVIIYGDMSGIYFSDEEVDQETGLSINFEYNRSFFDYLVE